MYCPECGKQNNDSAKFCYNCGFDLKKLTGVYENPGVDVVAPKETSSYHFTLLDEYTNQLKKILFDSYVSGRKIESKDFYNKAEHYEMNSSQVDNVFFEFTHVIEKINSYIEQLYLGKFRLTLLDEEKEELFNYCGMFQFTQEEANKLLSKYERKNCIEEKRKAIECLVIEYSKFGRLNCDCLKNFKNILQTDKQKLVNEFENRPQQIEKELDKQFSKAGNLVLSKEQKKYVCKIGMKLELSKEDIEKIISGYEKKNGIKEKLEKIKKEQEILRKEQETVAFVQTLKSEIEPKRFTLFERDITFDGRYLFENHVKRQLIPIAIEAEKEYKEIKHDRRSMSNICELLFEFEEKAYDTLDKIETQFHVFAGREIRNSISKYVDKQEESIFYALKTLGEIKEKTELKKQYRRARKDSRGRWVGGGFGIEGAIKGAMTAGALNLAEGAAHSAFNAVGNFASSISAMEKEDKVRERFDEIPSKLMEFMKIATEKIVSNARERYSDKLWQENKKYEEHLQKQLANDCEEVKKDTAVALLYSNPFSVDNYLSILIEVQDKSCFEILATISREFGIFLQENIKKYLEKALEENLLSDKVWESVRILKYKVYEKNDLRKFNLKLYQAVNNQITYSQYEKFYPKFARLMNEMDEERRKKNDTFWGSMIEGTVFDDSISTYKMEYEIVESPARNMLKGDKDCFEREMKSLLEYEEKHPKASLCGGLHRALKPIEDEFQQKLQQKESLGFEELDRLRQTALRIILCKKIENNPTYSLDYYFKQYCLDEFQKAIINSYLYSEEEIPVFVDGVLELKEVLIHESRATNTPIDINIIKKECSQAATSHLERINAKLEKCQENSNELEKIFGLIEFVQEFLEEEQILQMQSLYKAYIVNVVNAFMIEANIDVKHAIDRVKYHLKRFEEIYGTRVSKEIVESQISIIIEGAQSASVLDLLEERARLIKTEIITEPLEVLNNFQQARINWENRERTVYDFTTDYTAGNIKRSILTKRRIGILCESKERAQQIQGKVDLIEEIYQMCDFEKIECLQNSIKKIQEIYIETECGKVILDELVYRYQKLDEVERTVYDLVTDYSQGNQERSVLEKETVGKIYKTQDEARDIRKKIDSIAEVYQMCNLENIESVEKAVEKIKTICIETECGKAILDELMYRYQKLDEEQRTVLGVVYGTREEAELEAKKIVGNRKFNTEAEAEQERERILQEEKRIKEEQERVKQEKELEEAERTEILKLEERGLTSAQFLAALKRSGFKSNYAQNKEKKYEKEIWETYASLKKKNYPLSLFLQGSVKIIFIILFVYFVIASIVALFATIIGGIILGVITYFLWRGYRSSKDKINKLRNDKVILEEIEGLFVLQNGSVVLK